MLSSFPPPSPLPLALPLVHALSAGAYIVSGIEINTGGGAEIAAPTDKQQPQAKRGLGTVNASRASGCVFSRRRTLTRRQITYYVDARDGSDARRLHYSTVMPYGQVKDAETQSVYDLTSWMTWRRQVCNPSALSRQFVLFFGLVSPTPARLSLHCRRHMRAVSINRRRLVPSLEYIALLHPTAAPASCARDVHLHTPFTRSFGQI
jgi:hypothetical protein